MIHNVADPVSFFAAGHIRMARRFGAGDAEPSRQRNPMRQPQFIHSTTFRWALRWPCLAIFVIVLFASFIGRPTVYLIERSDRMIASNALHWGPARRRQLDAIAHISIRIPAAFNMPDYLVQRSQDRRQPGKFRSDLKAGRIRVDIRTLPGGPQTR